MSKYLALAAASLLLTTTITNAQYYGGGFTGGGFTGGGYSGYGNTGYSNGYTTQPSTGTYSTPGTYNNNGYTTNTGYGNGYTNTSTNNGYNTGYTNYGTTSGNSYGNTNGHNTGIGSSTYGPTITSRTGNTRAPVSTSVEVPITPLSFDGEPRFGVDNRGRRMNFFNSIEQDADTLTDDSGLDFGEIEGPDENPQDGLEKRHCRRTPHDALKTEAEYKYSKEYKRNKYQKLYKQYKDEKNGIVGTNEQNEQNKPVLLKKKLFIGNEDVFDTISIEKYHEFLTNMIIEKEFYIVALDKAIAKKEAKLIHFDIKKVSKKAQLDAEIIALVELKEKLLLNIDHDHEEENINDGEDDENTSNGGHPVSTFVYHPYPGMF